LSAEHKRFIAVVDAMREKGKPSDRKILELYITGTKETKMAQVLYCSQPNVHKCVNRIASDIKDLIAG
jgi:hypothetical protein